MVLRQLTAIIFLTLTAVVACHPVQAQSDGAKPTELIRRLVPYGEILAGHTSVRTTARSTHDEDTGKPLTFYQQEWFLYKQGNNKAKKEVVSSVECRLYLFDTKADANAAFAVANFGANVSFDHTVVGWTLGEKFRCTESGEALQFLRGRVMVKIGVHSYSHDGSMDDTAPARNAVLAEAIARGIEYTLFLNPAISHETSSSRIRISIAANVPPAVIIGDNAWVPLASLPSLGVQVARDEKRGIVTLAYQGRTLVITPFSRKARLENQEIDLVLPVLQQQQDVVVPIGAVARALQLPVPVSVL